MRIASPWGSREGGVCLSSGVLLARLLFGEGPDTAGVRGLQVTEWGAGFGIGHFWLLSKRGFEKSSPCSEAVAVLRRPSLMKGAMQGRTERGMGPPKEVRRFDPIDRVRARIARVLSYWAERGISRKCSGLPGITSAGLASGIATRESCQSKLFSGGIFKRRAWDSNPQPRNGAPHFQ